MLMATQMYVVAFFSITSGLNLTSPQILARDLRDSLFDKDSAESQRMKIEVLGGKTLVITGGHWKHHIVGWLKAKGF